MQRSFNLCTQCYHSKLVMPACRVAFFYRCYGSFDRMKCMAATPSKPISADLAETGREFYRRGWVLGTSGSFSALLARKPLRLCITASGNEKGNLEETNFLEIDEDGEIFSGFGTPAAEMLVHLTIYRHLPKARCILHTQSVLGTILSDEFFEQGWLEIEGYEILKGLAGVETHEHIERVPIVENSQDYVALSHVIENVIRENPGLHGVVLRRNGLYTWGETVADARRHTEIFEFLFEVTDRRLSRNR